MTDSDPFAAAADVGLLVPLAHGYLQLVANECGFDVLHIKGPAVDDTLSWCDEHGNPKRRTSFDADVLVRPEHVEPLIAELESRDWRAVLGFEEGSAFGHAMIMAHPFIGGINLHRSWPGFGLDDGAAFELLWQGRSVKSVAHVDCMVPVTDAQRLLLLIHAGRSGGSRPLDVQVCWDAASAQERARVRELARLFDAELALAAGIGELEQFRNDPRYRLWNHFAAGDTGRLDEWAGRWAAASGLGERARVARGFVAVNPDLLRHRVGPHPTTKDYAVEYGLRLKAAGRDLLSLARSRWNGGRG